MKRTSGKLKKRDKRESIAQSPPESILFVGDLHAGSHFAPWPWNPIEETGSAYMTDCFRHFVGQVEPFDLLVLNGDLIDGPQRKQGGRGVYNVALHKQTEGAIELLRPLAAKAKRIIRTDGTPYHEDGDNALGLLDLALGVTKRAQMIDLDLGNGILNIAHHPGGGSALYLGTKLDKEGIWSALAAANDKLPDARWIVRSHIHEYGELHTLKKSVVTLPAWQLPTPHATKGNHWRWQPDLGAVWMLRDEHHPGGYRFAYAHRYDPPTRNRITDLRELRDAKALAAPCAQ